MDEHFWPSPEAFLDLSEVQQLTDDRARCTGIAVCDADGFPTGTFYQGQEAHFFYEFEILREIGVPAGGLEFYDETGRVIHGMNTFQYGTLAPEIVRPGEQLQYHQAIRLEVSPGAYWFTVG